MRFHVRESYSADRRWWRRTLADFCRDDSGVIIATELVLILTILAIGLIVGLTTIRNALNTELADVGGGLSRLNQSFSYSGVAGHSSFTAGSVSIDQIDQSEGDGRGRSNGLDVNVPATSEGSGQ
jgi:Flp pilus assembly pilin Flp